jgi:hypothetical protein
MAHRSFVAAAFAGMWMLACGAGEVASTGGPPLDQSPPSNPNQPGNDVQHPTINPSQPAANPNRPGSSGGSAAEFCSSFCSDALACLRLVGEAPADADLAECAAECQVDLSEVPACVDVYVDLVDCIFGDGALCELLQGEFDIESAAQVCETEAASVQACVGTQPDPQPDPPVNDCTVSPNCACGGDVCLQCVCLNAADPSPCTESCAQAN